MFSAQMQYPGVDPWVAAWSPTNTKVSRAAAARYAVLQAVRERRTASRSARHTPAPVRVGSVGGPRAAQSDASARSDSLTPVG